jgi:hypothetical protein
MGYPPLSSIIDKTGNRGTITVDGNTITASLMQTSLDLQSWTNMPNTIDSTYEYTMSPEGNLTLNQTGRKMMSTLGAVEKNESLVLVKKE